MDVTRFALDLADNPSCGRPTRPVERTKRRFITHSRRVSGRLRVLSLFGRLCGAS